MRTAEKRMARALRNIALAAVATFIVFTGIVIISIIVGGKLFGVL